MNTHAMKYLEPVSLISTITHPRKVYLLLGYRCNEQCAFCGLGEDKSVLWPLHKESLYDTNEIKRKIDLIIEEGLSRRDAIEFSGGEPTIHRDLIEIIKYTRNRFKGTIFLFSNGVKFASRNYLEKYIEIHVDNTIITLHSHREDIFEIITGLKGSFNKTLTGLDNLHDLNQPISIKLIVNKLNYKYTTEWAALVKDRYPNAKVMINGLALWGQAKKNKSDLLIKHSETAPFIEDAAGILINAGVNTGLYFMPACNFDPYYWQYFGYRHYLESVLEAREYGKRLKSISFENCYNMPAECNHCVMQPRCVWAWKPYSEQLGLNELAPIYCKAS